MIVVTDNKHIRILKNDRSSLPEVFCKKGVLRNFSKFTAKQTPVPESFFDKIVFLQCAFLRILRNSFLREHLRWLLLK